jgi:hypothetical protein
MHHWTKRLFALAAPLLLTGCLWGPGKFNSDLTVRKDGSFVLDYRGEIVLQLPPDDAKSEPWKDSMARCTTSDAKERPCTKAEIASQKAEHDTQAEKKRKDAEQMAKLFGLPGLDDESNRAFAAKLTKYAGWRSATYRGHGVFDVDYHFEGSAKQDFLFPALPDNDLIVPFVAIRRRADGSVLITAPAMTGGAGPIASRMASMGGDAAKGGPVSRAEGRFTIITDGEILTNNSEDGAAPHAFGRQLHWDVGPASTKIPETLIRL